VSRLGRLGLAVLLAGWWWLAGGASVPAALQLKPLHACSVPSCNSMRAKNRPCIGRPPLRALAYATSAIAALRGPASRPAPPGAGRVAIGPGSVFQEHMMFRLVGGIEGHTAMTETYIRIHGQQLKAGTWRIRVSRRP
jgi:hypothetical protein